MIPYIISVGIILAACLVFYKILLQRETFYQANRYTLLFCLLISFGLPLLRVPPQWSVQKLLTPVANVSQLSEPAGPVVVAEKSAPITTVNNIVESASSSFDWQRLIVWAKYLYWFGAAVFGCNFLVQLVVLFKRSFSKEAILDRNIRIVEVTGNKAPCSFGNTIFINPSKYDWDTYQQILMHEKLHIYQKHSIDLLLAEIMLVLQWFNPFAWKLRKEMEANLEFLTDDLMMQTAGIDKISYQMSLLQVSAPHFPLSLTTNYNQSLLKKRITMMDTKKSSLQTIWKYFFLLPVLVLFACLLNQPQAISQQTPAVKATPAEKRNANAETKGSWFATIKGERISFQFKNDDDDRDSYNSSSFLVSEFSALPRGASGSFTLTREAGTMAFTGKFDGDQGMGHYVFTGDKTYGSYMNNEINEKLDERDLMVFFFVNIKKSYVQMIKAQGYKEIGKNDLIPLAALKIDEAYIKSLKESGFKDLGLHDLIPLKSLGIDGQYIQDIRKAGFPDISAQQLIAFKSQKIDKVYLDKLQAANKDKNASAKGIDADDVVAYKSLNIDDEYIKSFKDIGYTEVDKGELTAMKSLHITPEYATSFKPIGYGTVSVHDLIALKSLGITAEYAKSFKDEGYERIALQDLIAVKSLGITHDYAKSFQSVGYNNIPINELIAFKSQHVTPDFVKGFADVGYKNIPVQQIIALKSVGVTPEYIRSMKEKGLNYDNVEKYIRLKTID